MRSRFLIRLRPRQGDDGYMLLIVVTAMFVLTIVATGALGYAIHGVKGGKRLTDWSAALTAAQSGVDDFMSRLNTDEGYWKKTPQYGLTNGALAEVDCANVAWRVAYPVGVAPCGWNPTTPTGWRSVANSTTAAYHYDVDTSATTANGIVRIASTGKVGSVTRTVTAQLRRGGLGEFVYLSDFETIDPRDLAYWGKAPPAGKTLLELAVAPVVDVNLMVQTEAAIAAKTQTDTTARIQSCERHWYPVPIRSSPPCQSIDFTGSDAMVGPVHSNDAIAMKDSPRFTGPVTTTYPACQTKTTDADCYRPPVATPVFAKGITFRPNVTLPLSAVQLPRLREKTDPATTTNPGCRYTGHTRIVFTDDGKMRVWSPYTTSVNPQCGALSELNNAAGSGALVPVPANNVIYVDDVPGTQAQPPAGACQPNAVAPGFPQAQDVNMTDQRVQKTVVKATILTPILGLLGVVLGLLFKTTTTTTTIDIFGLSVTETVVTESDTGTEGSTTTIGYTTAHKPLGAEAQCRTGTVYVEGKLKGKVSLVAQNSILVTGDLTYADGHAAPAYTGHGTSVLGLVAGNSTLVYHPIKCTAMDPQQRCTAGTNLARPHTGTVFRDPKVHASVLALNGSVGVQAHGLGASLGTLSVFGSVAQRYSGLVGTPGTHGYLRAYSHDEALRYDPPPYFPDPTSGAWGVKTFAETRAAYHV